MIMMADTGRPNTIEFPVPKRQDRRRKRPSPSEPVPRIARLLALAYKWEGMVRRGEVKDFTEIAKKIGLSPARVTQICNLTLLSPRHQEAILSLHHAQFRTSERQTRATLRKPLWRRQ